jgi:hypothetical protein
METLTETKTIRELLDGKIHKAIEAMVNGIKNQMEREDFKFYFTSFGAAHNGICYGCAATCTIQEIAGKNLDKNNIDDVVFRAKALNFESHDLVKFEGAIDSMRQSNLYPILKYMLNTRDLGDAMNYFGEVIGEKTNNDPKKMYQVKKAITKLEYSDLYDMPDQDLLERLKAFEKLARILKEIDV